jgi:hypothetical protein
MRRSAGAESIFHHHLAHQLRKRAISATLEAENVLLDARQLPTELTPTGETRTSTAARPSRLWPSSGKQVFVFNYSVASRGPATPYSGRGWARRLDIGH